MKTEFPTTATEIVLVEGAKPKRKTTADYLIRAFLIAFGLLIGGIIAILIGLGTGLIEIPC